MFESVNALETEYVEAEQKMADPAIHTDQNAARKLGKRHAALKPIIEAFRRWRSIADDIEAAKELAAEDSAFAEEVGRLEVERQELENRLNDLLLPRDPLDGSDVILEIKSGEGGSESAIFAGDLMRMYLRWAERHNWKTEILDSEESDMGGYKDVSIAVKAKGVPEPGTSPYDMLKFEGGVHRVQRVPVTESQGRIHTSAAGVLVLPETEDIEIDIRDQDLRIDVYRSSGPGGQSVNTTDSAVRITHLPTGVVVSCQNEKSQLQNKESAMRILRARLIQHAEEQRDKEASASRKLQVRTVDRSERIRTYNYPENRISDHRVNYKAHNLDAVLDGDLDDMVNTLIAADKIARLAEAGGASA